MACRPRKQTRSTPTFSPSSRLNAINAIGAYECQHSNFRGAKTEALSIDDEPHSRIVATQKIRVRVGTRLSGQRLNR
jgi:hypothetical protein